MEEVFKTQSYEGRVLDWEDSALIVGSMRLIEEVDRQSQGHFC